MEISKSILTQINLLDIAILLFYLLGVAYLSKKFLKISAKFFNLFIIIGLFHFAFTLLYYYYTLSNVSDSVGFYRRALYVFENWSDAFGQGSFFIYFILYPLIHYLGISYFGLFFLFSFLGLTGFYFLYKIVININSYKWSNLYYLLLLPNVHFWTVAIGKDSLIYFAICWLLYNYYFQKKWRYFLIPILIIGLVRIHILVFITIAFLITLFFLNKKIKIVNKVILVSIISGIIYAASSIILQRVGIQEIQDIGSRLEELQFINQGGGSSVNMADENILIKWLAFLFRPFFFEAHNIFGLIVSIENIVWVAIFLKIFFNIRTKLKVNKIKLFYWASFISVFAISIPSAYILTNLGIAIRLKIMIFPFILVVFFIIHNNINSIKYF